MTRPKPNNTERVHWVEVAMRESPEFFLTVTFKGPYGDKTAIDAFMFAMRAIQRRIPSGRNLRGIATFERTQKKAHFRKTFHLHALLWGVVGTVNDPDEFINEVSTSAFRKLRDAKGRKMVPDKNVRIEPVYESEGAIRYILKDLSKKNGEHCQLWLIDARGFSLRVDLNQN